MDLIFELLKELDYEGALRLVRAKPECASMVDEEGSHVIHLCLSDFALVSHILSFTPDLSKALDGHGNTPLHLAVTIPADESGDASETVKVVNELLRLHPTAISCPNTLGLLPIHMAAASKGSCLPVVSLLLARPTLPVSSPICAQLESNAPPGNGNNPPLELAAAPSPPKHTNPARCRTADGSERLPIHLSAQYGAAVPVVVALLLAYPAGSQARCRGASTSAISPGKPPPAAAAAAASPQQQQQQQPGQVTEATTAALGDLPLHLALIHHAHADSVVLLIRAHPGALLEYGSCGYPPLSLALTSGAQDPSVLHEVLAGFEFLSQIKSSEEGEEYSVRSTSHQVTCPWGPALHDAIKAKAHVKLISTLLDAQPTLAAGAVWHADQEGMLPIHRALQCRPVDLALVRCLLTQQPDTALAQTRTDGAILVTFALELGTPMAAVRIIVDAHPDACGHCNHDGKLPLHYACWQGASAETLRLLLDAHPAGAEAVDSKYGNTPLHYAARYGANAAAVRVLLQYGPASASMPNIENKLPIHLAAHHGASSGISPPPSP
jgi:ankyrin repeat protein